MKTTPEYPITYRMKKDGFASHYNKECELYPTVNYEEKTLTKSEGFMMICIKCKTITHKSLINIKVEG